MMIKTGKTPISAITLCAILALSLVVNLPGLAVSPMLDTIEKDFPGTTQLETQMLTMLPNVLIIPFVLLSGRISLSRHRLTIVVAGLILFCVCAAAYFIAASMTQLIVISCLMGAGAGLIIPFSTGFLADTFSGNYLMREMGYQSGISNLTLVVATFAVGWLADFGNWHLPFVVYAIALIPLLLSPWLRKVPRPDVNEENLQAQIVVSSESETETRAEEKLDESSASDGMPLFRKNGFSTGRTITLFLAYFMVTSMTIVISFYIPFLCERYGWGDTLSGTATALYFLFIFLPGFALAPVVRFFKNGTSFASAAIITGGLAILAFIPSEWAVCLGSLLCGLGYGILQPIYYDKATRIVDIPEKSTLALSIILSANYVAIVAVPFFTDGISDLSGKAGSASFPFVIHLVLALIFTLLTVIFKRSFCFQMPPCYFKKCID